jgi:nucleoid-associated protein YgaU
VDDLLAPSKRGAKTKGRLPLITPPGTKLPEKKTEAKRPAAEKKSPPKPPAPVVKVPKVKKATSAPAKRIADANKPKPTLKTPPKPKERIHEVRQGDNFSILAEKYYGSQRFAELLLKANPQVKEARLLRLGTKLRIPPMKELVNPKKASEKTAAVLAADKSKKSEDKAKTAEKKAPKEKVYIVKTDDNFYSIAREIWGNGGRWRELHAMNKSICPDPKSLRPGMKLRITPSNGKKTAAKR